MVLDAALGKLYEDLPRQGVGADSCTREAIRRLPPLRSPPAILDVGCGSGRQTIVLASYFRTAVVAVDISQQSLDQLMEAAGTAGIDQWIKPRLETLTELSDPPESYDLIWCESAVRCAGLQQALSLWAPLLRKRGIMVVSDYSWVTPEPPEEAQTFWSRNHPGMADAAAVRLLAKTHGLRVYDSFALPRSVWRTEYYEPLRQRIAQLRSDATTDSGFA